MENIAIALLDIATLAHDWADDIASERGVDYERVRAWHGQRNVYFRLALEELQWEQTRPFIEVTPDYMIEF